MKRISKDCLRWHHVEILFWAVKSCERNWLVSSSAVNHLGLAKYATQNSQFTYQLVNNIQLFLKYHVIYHKGNWLGTFLEIFWWTNVVSLFGGDNIGLVSSVGRAPACQFGGHRFKSRSSKFFFVHPKFIFKIIFQTSKRCFILLSTFPLSKVYVKLW